MRSRRRNDEGSLDLLLDTITNTFGGILFLAILVALLLRTTSPSAPPTAPSISPSEQAAYEVRLEDLRDRLSRMLRPPPIITGLKPTELNDGQAEARRLRSDLAGLLQDQAHTGLVCAAHQRDCRDATEETSRLSERRSAAAERLVAAQQAMDAATAESKRLAALRITLEQHQKPNTIEQIVGLPTLRPNPKRQVGLLLRYNKLYMMHTWRNGVRLGPNPEHFIVTDGTPPVARAKPTAGIPVTEDTIAGDIRRLLTQFPANDWVVAVVVCEDSFGAFQTVKIAILEAGYEYRPLSLARGKAIADTGGQSESQ